MEEYCRIMIIDDEFIMRQGLKHMVEWEKEGFCIVGEASNGREGLEMIPNLRPHIILCDIVMPGMDGVEFAGILRDKYPEIKLIVLSGYDNFEYVRATLMYGAADYVLKPMLKPEELLATLTRTARQIPGLTLKKQEAPSAARQLEEYLLGKVQELPVSVSRELFNCTFYRIYAADIRKKEGKQDMASILYTKAEELLARMKDCKYVLLFLHEETMCVVLNYDARCRARVEDEIHKMTDTLTLIYGRFFAVLGKEFRKLSSLRDNFRECLLPSTDRSFYYRDMHLKVSDEEWSAVKEQSKFDFQRYSGLLGSSRYQEALDMLSAYVEEAVAGELDEYRLKNITKNMFYSLLTALEDRELEMDKMRLRIFRRIDGAPYVEEFLEILEETFLELEKILGTEGAGEDGRIRRILEYIALNYQENLNLKEVASVFHFNYYYLSAYFHTKVSEGFSGYLNRIRVEHACEILRGEGVPISEISGRVGYSDHSYFCRVFKKITGKTPSAYRLENRNVM